MVNDRRSGDIKIAVMTEKIENIERTVTSIETKMERQYVTKDELSITKDKLDRVEKILYGIVMAVLLAVVGGGMTLLINR